MFATHKTVWSVYRTYGMDNPGYFSTEEEANAFVATVLESEGYIKAHLDAEATYKVALEEVDRLNDPDFLEKFLSDLENNLERSPISDQRIGMCPVTPRDLISGGFDGFSEVKPYVAKRYSVTEPGAEPEKILTRWGRLRQQVARKVYRLYERIDPNHYDDDYGWDDYWDDQPERSSQ